MPTRKLLKGIAGGILGKVTGRNNDISSFWGVGYLYNLTHYKGVGGCRFELLAGTSTPNIEFSKRFSSIYKKFLCEQLVKNKLPESAVKEVVVKFEFNVSPGDDSDLVGLNVYGQPFRCTVILIADTGKQYVASHLSRCRRQPPTPPKDEGAVVLRQEL